MSDYLQIVPDQRIDDALHLQAELSATVRERAKFEGSLSALALRESEIALSTELLRILGELPKEQRSEFINNLNPDKEE